MNPPKLSVQQIQTAMHSAAQCDEQINTNKLTRSYWYLENWRDGVILAEYENGAGDHVQLFFTADGQTIIKGFDHESEVSPHAGDVYEVWPGIYDGVPAQLMDLLSNERCDVEEVTFCCWSIDGKTWLSGKASIPTEIQDGSAWLLPMLQMNADEFVEWGRSYYEDKFEIFGESAVRQVYQNMLGRDQHKG